MAAGEWPTRTDHVVILPGHTITVNATDDNKKCGLSPDGLAQSNVGSFVASNVAMFYHTGDITIQGSFVVTGIELMLGGYTRLATGGSFSPTSFLVNTGYLEVDAGTTLTGFNSLVLTGNSVTIINTTSSFVDDLIIDHQDATLCGTGSAQLQNGAGSVVTTTNSGSLNQICNTFTITCTGVGCSGAFPITGSGGATTGNRGPGGVGDTNGTTNLVFWLRADQLTLANNANVSSWSDQSGYNNHANAVAGREPVFNTNTLNSRPVVRFIASNTDYLRVNDASSLRPNNLSVFVVGQYTNSTSQWSPFLVKTSTYDWLDGYGIVRNNTDASVRAYVTRWDANFVNSNLAANTPTIMTAVYNNVNVQSFYNETSQGTDAFTSNITNSGNYLYLGVTPPYTGTTPIQPLDGYIAETFLFNRPVTLAERIIIHNYLAAKYNRTLGGGNDLYTMDDPGNGNYDSDVAGVGQASDGSNLKDAQGTSIVRMVVQSPSSLTNNEFLFWGHDNTSLAPTITGVGAGIYERITRVWRVSEVGDVGPVAISFDLNSYPGTPLGPNLRLLIDRDGDGFADNDVTPIGGGTYVGKVITFGGVNLQNGDRFTLGNTSSNNTLPITLVSFDATAVNHSVKLNWTTSSEIDNDYFLVQRSRDAEIWEDVVRVAGAGNSKDRRKYETTDSYPYEATSYYRLKQVDFDGTYSFSNVVSVTLEDLFALQVFPNPSTGSFRLLSTTDVDHIELMDALGKPVTFRTSRDGSPGLLVNTENLIPGIYILRARKGYLIRSVRLIVQ